MTPPLPHRLALIRRSALGDVVLTLPVAALLRRRGHRVALVTHPRLAPLLDRAADLQALPAADATRWADAVIDLHRPRLARRSIAPAPPLDALRRALRRPTLLDQRHALTRYCRALGLPDWSGPDPTLSDALLRVEPALLDVEQTHSTDAPPLRVGLAPASRWPTKAPPVALLAGAASAVARHHRRPLQPVVLSGPGEAREADRLENALRRYTPRHARLRADRSSATRDPLGLAACVAACDLVIAGDTGVAHLAQALARPTVVLFGPTSPARWGPWHAQARAVALQAPCRPCSGHGQRACRFRHRACLNALPVAPVLRAALDVLPPPPRSTRAPRAKAQTLP